MLLNELKVEKVISEPSSDGDTYIVRGLQYAAYERGEVEQPSVFVCECDTEEMAKMISDYLQGRVAVKCSCTLYCEHCDGCR